MGFLALRHAEQWQVALVAGLFGLGIGFAFASMANLIVGSVPADQTGVATGMNANIRTIGGSIAAAVTSVVLVTGRLQPSGLPYAFALLAVLCLAVAPAALLVPVRRVARLSAAPLATGERPRHPGLTPRQSDRPRACGRVYLRVRTGRPVGGAAGTWRSLVAHLTGGQGVAGSNPVVPTV